MAPGLIVAAPASGSGKTMVTLGLLRALAGRGVRVASAKIGPDYIDPAFHAAATGRPCLSLDSWAMRRSMLAAVADEAGEGADLVLCEGVMGLLDGADAPVGEPDGSTAEAAALTGWPVVLVVDARGMAASVAAVVAGFAGARPDVTVAGVIVNRVGGDKHRRMIARAMAAHVPDVAVLGFLPRRESLAVPSRHLGLVQACEHPDVAGFLARAAALVAEHVDLDALAAMARSGRLRADGFPHPAVPPLGQRIAVARDEAFAFTYPLILAGWRRAGAELRFFSPLAGQGPAADADAVYLPGGYPELYAARLAGQDDFRAGMRGAVARGAAVLGECGGYMVLGRTLADADGAVHPMLGLLPVDTSFAAPRRHLGYRRLTVLTDGPLGAAGMGFRGHEFHFASATAEDGERLFAVADAAGAPLPDAGCRAGRVMGSFVHLIDRA
ncbi:MAG: cobyrinate a,c-diamide synthase [Magnetospirillum sp.]|nr:cobyrinate a,c-diamide synthase [Magnetospirillum sp.]